MLSYLFATISPCQSVHVVKFQPDDRHSTTMLTPVASKELRLCAKVSHISANNTQESTSYLNCHGPPVAVEFGALALLWVSWATKEFELHSLAALSVSLPTRASSLSVS